MDNSILIVILSQTPGIIWWILGGALIGLIIMGIKKLFKDKNF